jgi:hypothetical protein
MQHILNNIKNIHNLKQAYIHREGKESISTFNAEKTAMMRSSVELIEQYFMVANDIERSYDEIIFPLENGDNLIALSIDKSTLAILLTKEKINLPMLHMALMLIVKKLKNKTDQESIIAATTTPTPQQTAKPSQEIVLSRTKILNTKPKIIQPEIIADSKSKKSAIPSLKSLFSNPFLARKSKNKDRPRPYSNTQATQTGKKLVYKE